MYQAQTISAGIAVDFHEQADFFRLLAAPATDCTVIFYRDGAEVSRAENIGAGYAEAFDVPFSKISIKSTGGGAVAFVTRIGADVRYDTPPTGNVAVTNTGGAFVNAQGTVANVSGQLLAAKSNRRYLLVQNNDAAGDIYLRLDGGAATSATGIKITAGGSYEVTGYAPTGAITAIGSVASNANIITVEG